MKKLIYTISPYTNDESFIPFFSLSSIDLSFANDIDYSLKNELNIFSNL